MDDNFDNQLPLSYHGKTPSEVAEFASREAGKILMARLGGSNDIHVKGKRNIVTEADLASEKYILQVIKEEYPQHGILSEEQGEDNPDREYVWIVDPLDGTNNFFFGIPYFCVNVALTHNEDVIMGVTYDPVRDEMFHATKFGGAFLNGSKIRISAVNTLLNASVGVDLGYVREQAKAILDVALKLLPQIHCLRLLGSASLGMAYVACGRFSLYCHRHLYPWDTASGLVLIKEAGGEVKGWSGKPANIHEQQIIAANDKLLSEFEQWLKSQ